VKSKRQEEFGKTKAIGISSYAFRYGIGISGFVPARPMGASEFLLSARRLDLPHAQLCENLGFADAPIRDLERIRDEALDLGLTLEIGMKSLSAASLERHLDICALMGAKFLRIVLGEGSEGPPDTNSAGLAERAVNDFRGALDRIRGMGLRVGIENHFDLATARLINLVDAIDDPAVGLVFDTTNCLGFIERPETTLAAMGRRIMSVHLKDYSVRKVEAGYIVSGEPLGEGLLDVRGILAEVDRLNPRAPVLLEMTVRRREGMSPEEAAEWERSVIEQSAAALRHAVSRLGMAVAREAP
jgi:3-oxoisoapionate decarboxylase